MDKEILSRFPNKTGKKLRPDEYLEDARQYLATLGGAMIEAARSDDPRVVALGLGLVRHQGVNR